MKRLALGLAAVLLVCLFVGCGKQKDSLDVYFETLPNLVGGMSQGEGTVALVEASVEIIGIPEEVVQHRDEWDRIEEGEDGSKTYGIDVPTGEHTVFVWLFSSETHDYTIEHVSYQIVLQRCDSLDEEREIYSSLVQAFGDSHTRPSFRVDDESLNNLEVGDDLYWENSLPAVKNSILFTCTWSANIQGEDVGIVITTWRDASGVKYITVSVLVKSNM